MGYKAPNYRAAYFHGDYGCERRIEVYRRSDGQLVGARDPFVGGVPAGRKAIKRHLERAAKAIIEEYEAR